MNNLSFPPIWLLHGALGSANQMEPLKNYLQSKSIHAETLEFSGHGETPITDEFGMQLFVQDILNQLKITTQKPLIFGYSMGGYAALLASIQEPTLMSGIITLGTKMQWNPAIAAKEVAMLQPEKIKEKIPAFASMLEERHKTLHWEKLLNYTANMMNDLGQNPLITESEFEKISIPVLYSVGDRDEMIGMDETIMAYKQTSGAAMAVLPGTRHPIEKLDNEMLLYLIENWIKLAAKHPTIRKDG